MQSMPVYEVDVAAQGSTKVNAETGYVQERGRAAPLEQEVDITPAGSLSSANRTEDPDPSNSVLLGQSEDFLTVGRQDFRDAVTSPQ